LNISISVVDSNLQSPTPTTDLKKLPVTDCTTMKILIKILMQNSIFAVFDRITDLCQMICRFLPRDAMSKRGLCCGPVSVHPSVCLSVCHVGELYPDGWRYRQTSLSSR